MIITMLTPRVTHRWTTTEFTAVEGHIVTLGNEVIWVRPKPDEAEPTTLLIGSIGDDLYLRVPSPDGAPYDKALPATGLTWVDTRGDDLHILVGGTLWTVLLDWSATNRGVEETLYNSFRNPGWVLDNKDYPSWRMCRLQAAGDGPMQVSIVDVDSGETLVANAGGVVAKPVWHGIVQSYSDGSPTDIENPGSGGADTYQRVYAQMYTDPTGHMELRFNRDLSGQISPIFFEDATFGFQRGGSNGDTTKGGLIRLYLFSGQTNSPLAGDQFPGGRIRVDPWRGYQYWQYSLESIPLGWYVRNESWPAEPDAGMPAEAWINGLASRGGSSYSTAYGTSQYDFLFADGRPAETSEWGVVGKDAYKIGGDPTKYDDPSGNIVHANTYDGVEGRWTATVAMSSSTPAGDWTTFAYDVAVHLDPAVPPTGDGQEIRRRFTR